MSLRIPPAQGPACGVHTGDLVAPQSQYGQDEYVKKLFPKGFRGIFVEAGAFDGLHLSNTLKLERELGWSGVLIEASPLLMERLRRNRPGAKIVHSCVTGVASRRLFSLSEPAIPGIVGTGDGLVDESSAQRGRTIEATNRLVTNVWWKCFWDFQVYSQTCPALDKSGQEPLRPGLSLEVPDIPKPDIGDLPNQDIAHTPVAEFLAATAVNPKPCVWWPVDAC